MNASIHPLEPQTARLPEKGDLIGGKYRVERLLGAGGMGVVVEAVHVELHQRVAVKVMLPSLVDMPASAARFLREGKAAAALRSEHAARILDLGRCEDGRPYLAMELLEGDDLDKLVRARGPLGVQPAVDYVLQACEAIAQAHALGIIHRDLKPSNLFLCSKAGEAPSIRVLDFGISKRTKLDALDVTESQGLTATDATLGSPRYISPEQLRDSRNVDGRTDIWSLGLVLHWLLTGRLAFEAETLGAHLAMIVSEPPTPLRERRPDAPAELEAAVLRCLEKQIDRRFQNVGQLALALAPFASPQARALVPRIVEWSARTAPPASQRSGTTLRQRSGATLRQRSDATLAPADIAQRSSDTDTQGAWSHGGGPWPRRRVQRLLLGATAVLAALAVGLPTYRALTRPAPSIPAAAPSAHEPPRGAESAQPAAAPPAPPAASEVRAPLPREVTVRLDVTPRGAVAELDGVRITGSTVRLPSGDGVRRVVVSADGYVTEAREISAQDDVTLSVSLRKQPIHAAPRPSEAPPSRPPIHVKGPWENDL
jgi:eukaryotic-like serine/threonine-protein kinase